MKILKIVLCSFLLISSSVFSLDIENHPFGLGIIAGQPVGLSGKAWLSKDRAVDGAVGMSIGSSNTFYIHGDYLFHSFDLIKVEAGELPVHFGGGLMLRGSDSTSSKSKNRDTRLGIRIPGGISYLFDDAEKYPFDLFAEIAPIVTLIPSIDIDLSAGIGGRFYF